MHCFIFILKHYLTNIDYTYRRRRSPTNIISTKTFTSDVDSGGIDQHRSFKTGTVGTVENVDKSFPSNKLLIMKMQYAHTFRK